MTRPDFITAALEASDDPMAAPCWLRWRVDPLDSCVVLAQRGELPADDDPPIGEFRSPKLTAEAVHAHNAVLMRQQKESR